MAGDRRSVGEWCADCLDAFGQWLDPFYSDSPCGVCGTFLFPLAWFNPQIRPGVSEAMYLALCALYGGDHLCGRCFRWYQRLVRYAR